MKKLQSEDQQRNDVKSLTIDLYTESKIYKRKKSLNDSEQLKRPGTKSNLKDYQKHTSNYVRKVVTGNYQPRLTTMKNTVQSYIRKSKMKDQENPQVNTTNTEEEEDMMFPSERPNHEVPVPHSMHPSNNKRFTGDFHTEKIKRISKNETNIDSKAVTEVSDNAAKNLHGKQRASASTQHPHYGEELEITVNKSEEENVLQESEFNNDSPIKTIEETFDFASLANTEIELEFKEQRKSTPVKLSYN